MSSSNSKDAYPRQVARMVAAELLKSKGIHAVQASCLEVLEDMLIRYMRELSRQSKQNAEVARRTSINPMDVVVALKTQGVSLEELEQYRRHAPDVDFAQGVSEFPVHKRVNKVQTFGEMGKERNISAATKIPEHFPAFPDVHSFVETEAYEKGEKEVGGQMKVIVEQKEKIGEALVKVHERIKHEGDADVIKAPGSPVVQQQEAAAMDVDAGDIQEIDRTARENENENGDTKTDDIKLLPDDKTADKTTTTMNPFLMPVKWEDKTENATGDIIELLRTEKAARLALEKKRGRDASVGNAGADILMGSVANVDQVNTAMEFSGFAWIDGGHDQRRTLAKSGARAPGVYDSGQGEHIQDKVRVEGLLARNQGHEGEKDRDMDAEEL